jgi:hypothetical protein
MYFFFTMLLSGTRCTCPNQANLCALMEFMMFLLPVSLFSSLFDLTLILLTWSIGRAPNNANRWQMGFNSAFKGLIRHVPFFFLVGQFILLSTFLSNTLSLVFMFSFTPRRLVQKKPWNSLHIDMLLSAVSVSVVVRRSSEIPEGIMNNPVYETMFLSPVLRQLSPSSGTQTPFLSV